MADAIPSSPGVNVDETPVEAPVAPKSTRETLAERVARARAPKDSHGQTDAERRRKKAIRQESVLAQREAAVAARDKIAAAFAEADSDSPGAAKRFPSV
jgi:hypothetical protein